MRKCKSACGLCKSAKVWSENRGRGSFAQRETGDRRIGRGCIFRSRVSAVRYLLRVFRFGCRCRNVPCPYLVLMT